MRFSSFNIVHFAVVVFLVILLVAILLPVIDNSRHQERRIASSNPLRGIHQAMVTYSNGNKNRFPGINEVGENDGITVEQRYQRLIENDFFTPEYAISPMDYDNTIHEWDSNVPLTSENYSYAMLQVPDTGGRRDEWSTTLNSQAITVTDRNTGSIVNPRSIHTELSDKKWRGGIVFNDNHTAFESGHTFETRYGKTHHGETSTNKQDHLFDTSGTDDALLIHSGNYYPGI